MAADTVTVLNVGLYPQPGAPQPIVLQDGPRAILVFGAVTPKEQTLTAVAELNGCLATLFAYPGDEALRGHPLYRNGLRPNSINEILHSTWLHKLRQQNIVAFPLSSDWQHHHFVIALDDSTFECIADDLTITTTEKSQYIALLHVVQDLD